MSRPSEKAITFGRALENMRQKAHRGVSEGIAAALAVAPPPPRRRTSYYTPGQAIGTLIDGILEAIVDLVLKTARSGLEREYAVMVAETLMAKIENRLGARKH